MRSKAELFADSNLIILFQYINNSATQTQQSWARNHNLLLLLTKDGVVRFGDKTWKWNILKCKSEVLVIDSEFLWFAIIDFENSNLFETVKCDMKVYLFLTQILPDAVGLKSKCTYYHRC